MGSVAVTGQPMLAWAAPRCRVTVAPAVVKLMGLISPSMVSVNEEAAPDRALPNSNRLKPASMTPWLSPPGPTSLLATITRPAGAVSIVVEVPLIRDSDDVVVVMTLLA